MDTHIEWFLEHRADIVDHLDHYAREITGFMPNYLQIADKVAAEKGPLLSLLSMPSTPLGSRIESCVENRAKDILACMDVVIQLLLNTALKAYEGLLMISRQVGRLRLVGLDDSYADEMDQ